MTLFAALDYLSGKVLAHTANRHRHREWLTFLKKIDASVDADKEIHIICDNYATHNIPESRLGSSATSASICIYPDLRLRSST
jgi:hypothetical protein